MLISATVYAFLVLKSITFNMHDIYVDIQIHSWMIICFTHVDE